MKTCGSERESLAFAASVIPRLPSSSAVNPCAILAYSEARDSRITKDTPRVSSWKPEKRGEGVKPGGRSSTRRLLGGCWGREGEHDPGVGGLLRARSGRRRPPQDRESHETNEARAPGAPPAAVLPRV